MVAGLNLRRTGAQTYLRELAFRDFYAAVLHCWPASAWHNWNSEFDNIQIETGAQAKRRFKSWRADETGLGWSVRGCGSCARPASCTTGCG
jgi:deoxyribodipyrimidine photo-lyase